MDTESVRRSVVSDSATPWTVVHQAPLSMELFRQGYRSGLSFPPPRDPCDPGIEPTSLALQADSLPSEPPWSKAINQFRLFGENCFWITAEGVRENTVPGGD